MENKKQSVRTAINAAFSRVQPFVLIITCIGILFAYLLGMHVTGSFHATSRWMGAMLACTSVVVVLQKTGYKESLQLGLTRVFGTFVGAFVAYVYLKMLPFTVVGMLMSVFVLEMIFMLLNIYNNGHIATITLLIIMLVSQMSPNVDPATNCMLRFFESAVGVGVGVGLLWIIDRWNKLRAKLLHIGANKDGQPVDMETMPLRWGHFRVLLTASLGQMTGAGLATIIGIVIPLLQIIGHPELTSLQQGAVACTSLIGITVGSVLFGGLSDKYGYLFFFRFCPALILTASLIAMHTDSITWLVISLFLMGLGIGGGYSLDSDYISEIMPKRWRLTMVGIAKAFSALGNIFAAVGCLLLLQRWQDPQIWNKLFFIITLAAIVMLGARIRFAQSPSWLMAHGRADEAERAVHNFLGSDVKIDYIRQNARPKSSQTSWGGLFRKENIGKIAFSGIPWACEGVGVYGIGVFLPALIMALGIETGSAAKGTVLQVIGSVEMTVYISLFILAGFILGLFSIRRTNHVRTQFWGFILSIAGLGLLLAAHELHMHTWVAVVGFMIFELFINAGPHLMTFIIPSQIYSVEDRGAGAGLAAAFGKTGAVIGVLCMPLLLEHGGMLAVLAATMGVLLTGALVTLFAGRKVLPETSKNE